MSSDQLKGLLARHSGTVFIDSMAETMKTIQRLLDREKSLSALLFGAIVAAVIVVFDQLIDLWAGAIWFGAWAALCALGFFGLAVRGSFDCDSRYKPGPFASMVGPRLNESTPSRVEETPCPRTHERRVRRSDYERRARKPNRDRVH
jgi:hypothetical protein